MPKNEKKKKKPRISLTQILRDILAEEDPAHPGRTRGEAFMRIALNAAVKAFHEGKFQFFIEVWNRVDGKVPDKLETRQTDSWEIAFETAGETVGNGSRLSDSVKATIPIEPRKPTAIVPIKAAEPFVIGDQDRSGNPKPKNTGT